MGPRAAEVFRLLLKHRVKLGRAGVGGVAVEVFFGFVSNEVGVGRLGEGNEPLQLVLVVSAEKRDDPVGGQFLVAEFGVEELEDVVVPFAKLDRFLGRCVGKLRASGFLHPDDIRGLRVL